MKRIRRIIVFAFSLIFSVGIFIGYFNEDSKLNLKADSGNVIANTSSGYQAYVQEKTEYHHNKYGENSDVTPSLTESIVIKGEDYIESQSTLDITSTGEAAIEKLNIADYTEYANSETAKAGGTSVVAHRGGSIVYKLTVSEPGFYNIFLNYYTFDGYSSNVERSAYLNNELPFSDSGSLSFSRVWKDKPLTKDGKDYNVPVTTAEDNHILVQKEWRSDVNGNHLKPQQIEVANSKVCAPFKDSIGYVTEPFEYYLEAGDTTLTFDYIKDYLVIDTIEIREVKTTKSYAEYLEALKAEHGSIEASVKNTYTRIEAEAATTKSSPTLYPITDRSSAATTPFSITKTYLNSIGGENWKVLGDWIAWDFTVPKSGYYQISMRAKQNMVRGMFSTRSVSLATLDKTTNTYSEYETLFEELNQLQISYSNKWRNISVGNNDDNYLFYFEEGVTYSLKMEVTLGDYSQLIYRLQNQIDALSAIYRRIISYTTTSPDANRDYELTTKFADLFNGADEDGNYTIPNKGEFNTILTELREISKTIKEISGGGSDKTGVIDSVVVILQKMVDRPRKIPQRLSTYSTQLSSLGSLLNELREAPLSIDYLEIHTPDVKLPKATAGFFKSLWKDISSFFASFFIDYSAISQTDQSSGDSEEIEVWMTLGRDQANVIRNLIDTSFSSENGYAVNNYGKRVSVNLKLTGGDVLLKATLAGIGPDVALNVDSSLPVNYALRNAVADLTVFDDFWDVVYAIPDGSTYIPNNKENVYMASSIRQFQFSYNGDNNRYAFDSEFDSERYSKQELQANIKGVFALPEKQIFLMMFVRDDVMQELGLADMFIKPGESLPDYDSMTWDDMIDLVSELQAQQLQFYLPVNDLGATALNPIFVSLLYQNGGALYINDNMECGLKSEEAMKAFEFWTKLYTNYSFPTSASFVNRFRTGEMPIGISYYEMYNTLSVFAPELKGKWSFHLIPASVKTDELGTTYLDHTATAAGTGAVLLKQEVLERDGTPNEKGKASWNFLKWWTSSTTQAQFGREMEGILGSAARHATANVNALLELAWPQDDLNILIKQWSTVHELPQIAGSYITGREMENAFRDVINNKANPRETLFEYSKLIDDEINRKRSEFNLPLLKDSEN